MGKKKSWKDLYKLAVDYKVKSETLLDEAVRIVAKEKGFSDEECDKFGACFAGGNETIIQYDRMGSMSDIDLSEMSTMTKEQIKKELNEYENCFDD